MTCTNSQGKCDASTRPKAEEACEDYSGCYEWKTGDWSKVSPAGLRLHSARQRRGLCKPELRSHRGPLWREAVLGYRASSLSLQALHLPVPLCHVQAEGNQMPPEHEVGCPRCQLAALCCVLAVAQHPTEGLATSHRKRLITQGSLD